LRIRGRAPEPRCPYADGVDTPQLLVTLLISLGLGLLVGLQREFTGHRIAGIRTLGLITLMGTISAMLAQSLGGWVVAAALVGVAAITVMANLASHRRHDETSPGVTSELAMLVMFAVGAYLAVGPREVAVAVGAGVAILLHFKPVLHGFVARLGETDVRAIMQFALISLIILPAVPDRTMGPYGVLNPRNIWLMVVLVVGMSLAGYVAYKFLGRSAGLALCGLLGGLISSTATTVSYARRAAATPGAATSAAAVIMIASTVVYGRLLIEIAVTSPAFLRVAAPPLLILAGISAASAVAAWMAARHTTDGIAEQSNPTQLRTALFFGAMYAVVLIAVATAKANLGQGGLYAVAGLSGLTDMDAITLSVSRMVAGTDDQQLEPSAAWRAIVIASMSNMTFKGIMAATLGGRALATRIAILFGIMLAASGIVLVVW
jgi:uncharacterized membrane protein (DUF4010 family)